MGFDVEQQAVSWESIIGTIEAKQRRYEIIVMPTQHAEVFAFYGKRREKGIVLYGPPGCGKTLCAKAVATSLATLSYQDTGIQSCVPFEQYHHRGEITMLLSHIRWEGR